jgi:hypothetical protein
VADVADVAATAPTAVKVRPHAAVKVLTVLGFTIPAVAYLALMAHYQVNAVLTDEWGDVHVIVQNAGHFPDWSSLWALHTDNRVLFPNLIVIALAHTVSLNVEVEEYLSALMLFASVTLLIWAHKRRSQGTPLLYYVPVAFVMLTFAQWQNTLWGFQLAWYLVLLSLAASVFLLDRVTLTWPVLVAAALVAVVGSYSSIQGLLIWPVGLVLLYHRRRLAWAFVGWIAAGLVTTALYFYNYHSKSVSPLFALKHPLSSAKLFLFALGDIVGVQTPAPHGASLQLLFGESDHAIVTPGNAGVLLFGGLILALAVFVVVRWGIHRDPESGSPIGIALIVYGLLFGALITDGRVLFGYWGVSQSRYTTYDALVVVGIYLTALSRARADRRTVTGIALGVMAIQVVFSAHYGIAGARSQQQADLNAAALTRAIDHESELTIYSLDIGESPQEIRQDAAFLREHHLSLYG